MKKQNPIYLFVVIFAIAISSFSMIAVATPFGNMFFVFIFVAAIFMFGSFMRIAKGVTNDAWEEKTSRKKSCTHCTRSIPIDSIYCPICGKNVEKTVVCSYCGESNPEGIM
ncbi:MAG: zinc ribbon domain-containing protein [Firmicutes bacterium]|nr:zinc ribbon domain-containing protein [Bacillota bacterium]